MTVQAFDKRVIKEDYRNYDLVSRFWKGSYRGKVWKSGEAFDEFKGNSLEEIIQIMRAEVDERIDEKTNERHLQPPTSKQLKQAFTSIWKKLTPQQINLLKAHVNSTEFKVNLTQLQRAGGFSSTTQTMLEYAKIGNRLTNELCYLPNTPPNRDPALAVLLEFDTDKTHTDNEFWVLQVPIALAIESVIIDEVEKQSGYRFAENFS